MRDDQCDRHRWEEMKEKATVTSNGGGNGENTDEQTLSRANNAIIQRGFGVVDCMQGTPLFCPVIAFIF